MSPKSHIPLSPASGSAVPSRTDLILREHAYRRIRDLMQQHCGVSLSPEKKTLVANRLYNDVVSGRFRGYDAYLDAVEADRSGLALDHLASLIVTHHTYFFREEAHFDYLKTHALPAVAGQLQRARDNDLRVWCAAASTGEEAYSLIITLLEYFGSRYTSLDAGVLATDISTRVLSQARRGVYSVAQSQAVPALLRQRYFHQVNPQQYEVLPQVRAEVLFRKFNLMTAHYPFKRPFHIIYCRNVMIYFDAETRRRLVHKLYDCTAPGGYLFIGHAETIEREVRGYVYVRPAVYRKLS